MNKIEHYMNDGANYQTQMILAYLRGHECEIKELCHLTGEDWSWSNNNISVGRFENCREQGYIFGVNVRDFYPLKDKWMVVEHRSSDSIKIRHFRADTINTPDIETAYNDEYLVDEKWFTCEDIISAGEFIMDGMENAINDYKDSEQFQRIVEKHDKELGK